MIIQMNHEINNNQWFYSFLDVNFDIRSLDIPVNAVATALKDFFSKRLPPLIDKERMNELEDISGARGINKPMSSTCTNTEGLLNYPN